jgi:hypothetical protein
MLVEFDMIKSIYEISRMFYFLQDCPTIKPTLHEGANLISSFIQ